MQQLYDLIVVGAGQYSDHRTDDGADQTNWQ